MGDADRLGILELVKDPLERQVASPDGDAFVSQNAHAHADHQIPDGVRRASWSSLHWRCVGSQDAAPRRRLERTLVTRWYPSTRTAQRQCIRQGAAI